MTRLPVQGKADAHIVDNADIQVARVHTETAFVEFSHCLQDDRRHS